MDHLACPAGGLVLDAGCGSGRWAVALARRGYRVRAIDLCANMILEAQVLAAEQRIDPESVKFEICDIQRMTYDGDLFDAVLCRNVIDFVPQPAKALEEIWRVLKPGKRLVLSTLGAYSPAKRTAWQRLLPGNPTPCIFNHILPWEVEALLRALGWEIVAQRPDFGPTASGMANEYTQQMADQLNDRVLQQTVASLWEFIALKPEITPVSRPQPP